MPDAREIAYDDVPGTIHLLGAAGGAAGTDTEPQLVLQPRPSSNPEDPLNWTRRRKLLAIGTVYLYVFAIGVVKPVVLTEPGLYDASAQNRVQVTSSSLPCM